MRRNIFTSYIICNFLNLKTFFEPIIDFIGIGKRSGPPPRTVYENFISYGSNRNTKILVLPDMCNRKLSSKLLNPLIQSFLKIQKNKNPKVLSCGYNAKISSRLICLYGDDYRPLESSFYLFYSFFIVCNAPLTTVFFIIDIDRNSLVKTL